MMPRKRSSLRFAALVAASVVLAPSSISLAGEKVEAPPAESPQTGRGMAGEGMMAMHQKMLARMQAMDQRLDGLLAEMQAASGDAKIDAVAVVVTELVEQRREMHGMMAEMQPRMMQQMGACMMQGMMPSMGDCPMMQKSPATGDSSEGSGSDHEAHHPDE